MLAVGIKMTDCNIFEFSDIHTQVANKLFSRGCWQDEWGYACSGWAHQVAAYTSPRCKQCKADSVFMFFSSVLLIGGLVLGYLRMRKGN